MKSVSLLDRDTETLPDVRERTSIRSDSKRMEDQLVDSILVTIKLTVYRLR